MNKLLCVGVCALRIILVSFVVIIGGLSEAVYMCLACFFWLSLSRIMVTLPLTIREPCGVEVDDRGVVVADRVNGLWPLLWLTASSPW